MKIRKFLTWTIASAMLLNVACKDDETISSRRGFYGNGILISNEGKYLTPNASVTFISEDLNYLEQNIYGTGNPENLGDVLQNIGFNGNLAYLVLNNSNKITIVDRFTFQKTGQITDEINQPKFIAFSTNYIYVTNDEVGGEKYVSVYNLADFSFVKKLEMPDVADRIVEAGGNIFVQNASFGFGNKISAISTSDNTVLFEISVPNGQIQKTISENGSLYAIASDAVLADSYIYQISPTDGNILKTITLSGISNAMNLCIDGGNFYFTSGMKIYEMNMNATEIPVNPIVTASESQEFSGLFGFNVIGGKIFTSDANGFTADSKITVYNTSGSVIKIFNAGIGSNGFYKN
ncbi:MAG: hypothetical protein LBE36_08595 [Flavobacteriaceae bacterium]|jgi:hypothetical protein|nr:hypothetical protein [Flavobacteriaceae bacterium]